MIRHIFCDLDGTLYHGGISEEDSRAIERIEEQGVKFHVATGRIFKQAYKMVEDSFDLDGYYICENGAFIHNKDGDMVFKKTIDDNLVKKVINRFESNNAHLYFKYDGKIVIPEDTDAFNIYSTDVIIDKKFVTRDRFDNLVGNIGVVSEDVKELNRIELYLKSEFNEVLDIYFSSSNTLNLVHKDVSKIKGIEYVCTLLNVSEDEIATIGDSPNDINMLENIKYSFAMEGAREDVKKSSNYTSKSVSEVIKIIEKINGVEC
ncbi:HAD family phosphatase [Romboutsia weinsteinii]|uniref:HAD family phosphatase n=1 Tax=Romboutsia weinsteinii TaxID=2020949 RepID=A0A371J9R2_9FIRM|nr:HAD family hydrolase [Romboutsia weinsteinii]RDY29484.1 HAD family phosphatase [Romboutsia weinsteinii]